jgi:hypothetical protein
MTNLGVIIENEVRGRSILTVARRAIVRRLAKAEPNPIDPGEFDADPTLSSPRFGFNCPAGPAGGAFCRRRAPGRTNRHFTAAGSPRRRASG